MLIELSELENMPVGALDEGALIGSVRRVVVNPDDARVIGFTVKSGVMKKILAASFSDVIDIDKAGVVVASRDSLVSPEEIVRLEDLVKKKFSLIGLPAKSKNKESLGKVTDAVIETTTGDILRLYTKKLIEPRVFERAQIIKMTLTEVILDIETNRKAKEAEKVSFAAETAEMA